MRIWSKMKNYKAEPNVMRDGKVIKIELGMMNEFDVEDIAKLI